MNTTTDRFNASRLERLIEQMRWVMRISTALTEKIRLDDLYTMILSAIASPDGLDYSRAYLFTFDRITLRLKGRLCMGPASRAESDSLRHRLREEADYLKGLLKAQHLEAPKDESPHHEALHLLQDTTHWIDVAQSMESAQDVCGTLSEISVLGPDGSNPPTNFLSWAMKLKRPSIVQLDSDECPKPESPLLELMQFPAVALPLRTPKGLRGVILADRRFDSVPEITETDLQDLDWFAIQAALAIENAELIEDLEAAYNQLQELDTLKSNFLSIVSHELRTPMTAIMGVAELLLNERVGPLLPNQRSLLVRAQKNANHLLQIVNDLIEVTEVQAEGMRNLQLRPVDPLTIFFSTLPKLDQRRRDMDVDIEPIVVDAVPKIWSDPRSLERILFHLLDNAIKFSARGKRVEVEFRRQETRLAIAVRDYGIGIPPDRLQRIFDSFYQIDNRLTRSYEGLGLGLTVTRLLITATRGDIHVESRTGEGSTFTISYPIAETPSESY